MLRIAHLFALCLFALSLAACGSDSGGGGKGDSGDEGGISLIDGSDEMDADLMCMAGDVCTVPAQCGQGNECESAGNWNPEAFPVVGGEADPILGHPTDEDTAYSSAPFEDGYCTSVGAAEQDDPAACTQVGCGGCGVCVPSFDVIFGDQVGFVFCAAECDPANGSADCTNGNICAGLQGGGGACVPGGCKSDDECHVGREDTNENGKLDPYDATDNPGGDRLRYFTTTDIPGFTADCDDTDRFCTHSGSADGEAGKACVNDFQCEENGFCIDGICTAGCSNTAPCAGDGECIDGACYQECDVASHVGDDPLAAHTQCVAGGACSPEAGADDPFDGVCVGGTYTDVETNNVGAPCVSEVDCYSPYGFGFCTIYRAQDSEPLGEGFCSVLNCADPAIGEAICGAGGKCVEVSATTSLCAKSCTTGANCQNGQSCVDFGGDTGKVCVVAGCEGNADCKTGTCDVATGACIDDCTTAADCGAGQACGAISQTDNACFDFCFDTEECREGQTCVKGEDLGYGRCGIQG
jgi:hypothetical protein